MALAVEIVAPCGVRVTGDSPECEFLRYAVKPGHEMKTSGARGWSRNTADVVLM
jgi:hypothetical protein